MDKTRKGGVLREVESNYRVSLGRETRAVDNRVRIGRFEEDLRGEMKESARHLQFFLDQLESCESESEIAQEADLKIQNWKFLLELENETQ